MISVNRLMSLHKYVLSSIEKVIFHDKFNIHSTQNIRFDYNSANSIKDTY